MSQLTSVGWDVGEARPEIYNRKVLTQNKFCYPELLDSCLAQPSIIASKFCEILEISRVYKNNIVAKINHHRSIVIKENIHERISLQYGGFRTCLPL